MSTVKTIVCLANSWKPPSGRCVAGIEYAGRKFGPWIRPISERDTEEISEEERHYENGADPALLDIVAIAFKKHKPHLHQQENFLIDDSLYWTKTGMVTWSELQGAVEDPAGPLWLNGFSSSNGQNDRVPEGSLGTLNRSLYLVRPENLVLAVKPELTIQGSSRRKVRASFSLSGFDYKLSVTDPVIQQKLLAGKDGDTKVKDALLCVSLGGAYFGSGYKLVAGIVTPKRAGA